MLGQQHVQPQPAASCDCEFDILGVPISLSVDSIYLAASALLIEEPDCAALCKQLVENDIHKDTSLPSLRDSAVLNVAACSPSANPSKRKMAEASRSWLLCRCKPNTMPLAGTEVVSVHLHGQCLKIGAV